MTSGLVVVDSDAEMEDVIDLLIEHRVGALPVVQPGTTQLVGIVSYVDVLRAVRDSLDTE